MKIQTSVVILLSLAWSIMASPPHGVERQGNHRQAATINVNILETFKKTPAGFDSFRLESREDRLNALYQLQKNEADRVKANGLKLQEDTNSAKKHHPNQLRVSNELIDRNVDMQKFKILDNEDVQSKNPEICMIETIRSDALQKDGGRGRSIPCRCLMKLDGGEGKNVDRMWYFNVERHRCEVFFYNGYGGNDNRFTSHQKCKDTCEVA